MREVAVNEAGLRIGEDHHESKLTDSEIERIRSLHEDDGLGYGKIARIYEISKGAVAKICRYERRAQFPTSWKRLPTDDDLPRIEELRAKGMEWPEVSEALGIPDVRDAYRRLVAKKEEQEYA
ncbi:hypothetical protein AB6Q56_07450 [Dechloromonas sp. ARDL1]|uniref:hypothetical protein n=1 Tax=Dechloromonas sp. ARDL1 TaxID=3322121 RepID=UPI003DA75419